ARAREEELPGPPGRIPAKPVVADQIRQGDSRSQGRLQPPQPDWAVVVRHAADQRSPLALESGSGSALMPERKGGLIAKGEANGVCCSDWAGQADSKIFNPDDLHSFHDGHASPNFLLAKTVGR